MRMLEALIRNRVEKIAEPWAMKHIGPTFDGDPEAATSLCLALGNPKRGAVAVALWQARVPVPAFREFLASVWDHDHEWLIESAGGRRRLAAMFRYANFPVAEELPERVRVWRGTSALTFAQARRGYSWTTSRDVACWFAMRFAATNGQPLLLMSEVNRNDIALWHNGRDEHEAVLLRPPAEARIDGGPDEWQRRYRIHGQRAQERFDLAEAL